MVLILRKLVQGYFKLNELADPRVDGYFLMTSPFQPVLLGVLYLYLIKKVLPCIMKNRPAFTLEKIMIAFNLTQVLVNSYLCFHTTKETRKIDWSCGLVDYSDTPYNKFVVRMGHVYFMTKVADLLDTVFFVLRGKTSHVSFLHVYHHFGMIIVTWTGVKFMLGGHSIFLVSANSFVHAIMYFYYLLTIWKPEYKGSIWWKKQITHLQLFVFFIVIYGQLLFKPHCSYPKIASYVIVPQSIFMVILFSDFYYKAYIKPQKVQKQK